MATLIYDGDCDFCKKWVDWLTSQNGPKIQIHTFQKRPPEFRHIPTAELEKAVHLVNDDGRILKGAAAIFSVLAMRPQGSLLFRLYRATRLFSWPVDKIYRFIADHRKLAAWSTYIFWGDRVLVPRYEKIRRLFLGILGFCYLSAFVSLAVQVKGLIGENGIFPAKDLLDYAQNQAGLSGAGRLWALPTIAWLGAGNHALIFYCAAGALFSLGLLFNLAPRLSALGCWILYLSLTVIGNVFLGYQWEALLLEAGFLALFLAPWGLRPRPAKAPAPRFLVIWLYRWLLFRLMFSSGIAKLILGDSTWKNLTALDYHFETQPLPTWIGWYAAQLPHSVHAAMTGATLVIESVIPLFFFLPRRWRIAAFWFQLLLQIAIILTGNYCYFNVLTVGLCLFLLDDQFIEKLFSLKGSPKEKGLKPRFRKPSPLETAKRATLGATSIFLVLVGATHVKNIVIQGEDSWDRLVTPLVSMARRFDLVNSYGLFVDMTTERDEIVIEGSRDGNQWIPYEFPYKPGDPGARPRFVAPYQPRLDWQAWFAALGTFENQRWLQNLILRLLQGQEDVLSLLKTNPFPHDPPRYIRVQFYQYKFTDMSTRRSTGQWWTRVLKGPYSPVLSLQK